MQGNVKIFLKLDTYLEIIFEHYKVDGKKITKCKSPGSHSQGEICEVINKYILVMQFENNFWSITVLCIF